MVYMLGDLVNQDAGNLRARRLTRDPVDASQPIGVSATTDLI